jgi:hypothetical protein
MSNKGFYLKYHITKADGSPCDSDAVYFVLRIDRDPAARIALRTYADNTPNHKLALDLDNLLATTPLKEALDG